jgi:hypothetical protein
MEKNGEEWEGIKNKSMEVIKYLNENGLAKNINNVLYQFLDDFDVRQKDPTYGRNQIERTERELAKLTDKNMYQPIA